MIVAIRQHTVKGTSLETGWDAYMLFAGEPVPGRLEPVADGTHRIDVPNAWHLVGPGEPLGAVAWLWHPDRGSLDAEEVFLAACCGDHGFRLLGTGEVIEEVTP